MTRRHCLFLLLFWLLTACSLRPGGEQPAGTLAPAATVPATPVAQVSATAGATMTVAPSVTPSAIPSPTDPPTAAPVTPTGPPPQDLSIGQGDVFIYPPPMLYSGDRASVQIMATVPENISPGDVQVQVLVNEQQIASGTLNGRNLGGDAVGLFAWVWDTSDQVGTHQVSVVLDPQDLLLIGDENPDNNRVDMVVDVRPADELPFYQVDATWITRETEYATLHVVSGTAAARDLRMLQEATDTAVRQVAERLQEQPQRKLDIYFIDRVLGQGGYASSSMVISYLDRSYVGNGLHEVLTHEITHLIDQQFAHHGVVFLSEGVAVWASGGHYKQENLDQRMAALRTAGLYVPLTDVINNFYPVQHEIGYLEGAGFVNYLVAQYGWPAVRAFYGDVTPDESDTVAGAVDMALQRHFGRGLLQIEQEWTGYLDRLPYGAEVSRDLLTTVRYYDLMRDYQLQYDPTAHFLQAWLPYPHELENRGITADLTRRPSGEVNVALETMLQAVDGALRNGNYDRANALLDSVERVLTNGGVFHDPIASHYLGIVRKVTGLGYHVQAIEVNGNQAIVTVHNNISLNLSQLNLVLRGQGWILTN